MHTSLKLFLMTLVFLLAGFASREALAGPLVQDRIVISVASDGVLFTKLPQRRGLNIIYSAAADAWYQVNLPLAKMLLQLAQIPRVKIVFNSAGKSEIDLQLLDQIKISGNSNSLRTVFSEFFFKRDLVPSTPEIEAQGSFLYRPSTQLLAEDRGYKNLEKIAQEFNVPLSNVFHIDVDGRFVRPDQIAQWVRVPIYDGQVSGQVDIAMAQIYPRILANGAPAWNAVGPTLAGPFEYIPGSASPQPSMPDYYTQMPSEEYKATRFVSLDIAQNFPKEQYHYLMLGRSPIAIGRFLENIFPESVSYIAFSGGHLPGQNVQRPPSNFLPGQLFRKLTPQQEEVLFEYFARALPSMQQLAGKKLLIVDMEDTGQGLASFASYLKLYMERTGYNVEFVEFAIAINGKSSEFKQETRSDVQVVTKYYGSNGGAMVGPMKQMYYEQVAPYGRFLPSKDQPPAAGAVRPEFEIFGYNMRLSMQQDGGLKNLLSNSDFANFNRQAPAWLLKKAFLTNPEIARNPDLATYVVTQIQNSPANQKYALMKYLLDEIKVPTMHTEVLERILPQFSAQDLAVIVPEFLQKLFQLKPGEHVNMNDLMYIASLYPEYFSSEILQKSITALYQPADCLWFLELTQRIPDLTSRNSWRNAIVERFQLIEKGRNNFDDNEAKQLFATRLAEIKTAAKKDREIAAPLACKAALGR